MMTENNGSEIKRENKKYRMLAKNTVDINKEEITSKFTTRANLYRW